MRFFSRRDEIPTRTPLENLALAMHEVDLGEPCKNARRAGSKEHIKAYMRAAERVRELLSSETWRSQFTGYYIAIHAKQPTASYQHPSHANLELEKRIAETKRVLAKLEEWRDLP